MDFMEANFYFGVFKHRAQSVMGFEHKAHATTASQLREIGLIFHDFHPHKHNLKMKSKIISSWKNSDPNNYGTESMMTFSNWLKYDNKHHTNMRNKIHNLKLFISIYKMNRSTYLLDECSNTTRRNTLINMCFLFWGNK